MMINTIKVAVLLSLVNLFSVNAGMLLYKQPYEINVVSAPVQIKDKGMYNLIIGMKFLNKPTDDKKYKEKGYENLMERLSIEWSSIAISRILTAGEVTVPQLDELKKSIEEDISKYVEGLKEKFMPGVELEIVYAIQTYFLNTIDAEN